MRSSVLLFAASLALTSAEAGEAAKQGEENATAYYVAIPDSGSTVQWVGIRRSDSGDPMFDKMGVNSTDLGGHGTEVQMDPSGDQIFVTWGPSEFHYTGGTGKFAGISGEGTWSCTHPRSPDAGIELAICTQKSSWKLP
jgi:hypothetical protein